MTMGLDVVGMLVRVVEERDASEERGADVDDDCEAFVNGKDDGDVVVDNVVAALELVELFETFKVVNPAVAEVVVEEVGLEAIVDEVVVARVVIGVVVVINGAVVEVFSKGANVDVRVN